MRQLCRNLRAEPDGSGLTELSEHHPDQLEGRPSLDRTDAREPIASIDGRLFVASVEKGLQVLRAFYNRPRALSLSDVAELAGMSRSSAQRFLYTLKALGYLRQDPETRRYTLSPRVLDFGFAYLRNDALVETAFPYLLEASKRTRETVNLTELDGPEVIYVSRFPSRNVISVDIVLGARLPVYCTAPGRVMLAHMDEAAARQLLARSRLAPRTPYTEVDPDRILTLAAEARRRGYAVSNQETFVGDISVAAPVRDHAGRVSAAVNVAVPHPRWSVAAAEEQLAHVVVETARAISKAIGGA
jgi:IclR family transcriptional regulator, pca regulon regulatory protein